MNNVNITKSVWIYAIHSKNAELIHILEFNKNHLNENDAEFSDFLIESIKCHHNDIAEYIKDNLCNQNEINYELIMSIALKVHNYNYFQNKIIYDNGFVLLCIYNYNKLVKLLLESKEKEIKEKII